MNSDPSLIIEHHSTPCDASAIVLAHYGHSTRLVAWSKRRSAFNTSSCFKLKSLKRLRDADRDILKLNLKLINLKTKIVCAPLLAGRILVRNSKEAAIASHIQIKRRHSMVKEEII